MYTIGLIKTIPCTPFTIRCTHSNNSVDHSEIITVDPSVQAEACDLHGELGGEGEGVSTEATVSAG